MTNWDINNYEMLKAGAEARQMHDGSGWQSMDTAPRDGTIVELRCTYGVAPHYGLFEWKKPEWGDERWCQVGNESAGISEDMSWNWRPYQGDIASYIDPTGGAQDSPAYWRGAVAAKHGLPLDAMEKDTFNNTRPNAKSGGRLQKLLRKLDFG